MFCHLFNILQRKKLRPFKETALGANSLRYLQNAFFAQGELFL